ncbi:TonB-dependent siderophore receptor [Acidovorax sp. SDU_ACID1]|uniref:TonB-dependent siderophore receptor n=1 Tax=Acidovorax sp. SDU_ACID1 TaxID=3136632 RepID=UPI003873A89B
MARCHSLIRPAARAALLALACAATGAPAQPAEGAPQPAQAAQEYRIAPGALDDALARYATQAGISLDMPQPLVRGRSSPGLQGRFGVREGLARLLAGTGLEAVVRGPGVYQLRAVPEVHSAAPATLDAVRVTAQAERGDTTEGTGSYTTRSMGTATGLNLSMRETPQSVTVVTRQQMDDQGLGNVAQVLERTTGITTSASETDRVVFRARGFDISKIQYDGIPLVEDNRYDTDFVSDTAIYDRVEIVRGATGLLSGTGQPSAAINLVRKKPTAELQGHVQLSAGSWDAYRTELDLSGPLAADGRIRGRMVASYLDRKSYLESYSKDISGLYGVLEADLAPGMLLTAGIDYQNRHAGGTTFGSTVPLFYSDGSPARFPRSTSSSPPWTYADVRRVVGFATLEQRFGNGWQAKLHLAHRDTRGSVRVMGLDGYPDRATGEGVSPWFNSYDTRGRQRAVNVHASGPFSLLGRTHELILGYARSSQPYVASYHTLLRSSALASYNDRQSYPAPEYGTAYSHFNREQRKEEALYAATRWHLAEPLKLIAGARLTHADYAQDWRGTVTTASYRNELTPYAGIVYDVSRNVSAYASYTDIFQTQTLRDRHNALLKPLVGTNVEAGLKGELYGGRLNVSAAIFKVRQDNLAELDEIIEGEYRYKTVDGATTRGYELEVSGEPLRGWELSAGFTRRIFKDRMGVRVQTTEPSSLLRLTSAHRLPGALHRVTLGGHLSWQSRIYATGRNGSPTGADVEQSGHALVHLFGIYQATPRLDFQLNVNNLFDKTYYAAVGGSGRYGDSRSVTVSMKYRF